MYKINLHITNKCNYHCKYCFGHFHNDRDLSLKDWFNIIDNINQSNLINAINFAGGEPVLYKGFEKLLDYAYKRKFETSIISNGSLLMNKSFVSPGIFEKLHTVGISIDSFNPNILRELGRCTNRGKILNYETFKNIVFYIKHTNPAIKIKLNTVVNKINLYETLFKIEKEIPIDRWKFLKIKEFEANKKYNSDLLISYKDYYRFVKRNYILLGDEVLEDDLTHSYIIVDNNGNLLDNQGTDYNIIGNLLKEDFSKLFSMLPLNKEKYFARYNGKDACRNEFY